MDSYPDSFGWNGELHMHIRHEHGVNEDERICE